MNYECIDVSDWGKIRESTKGSRDKQWILKPLKKKDGGVEIFLFKESSKRYPAEFWSETIASEVGKIVGVPTPETYCAKMGEKYAALIKFFLKIEWNEKVERYQRVEALDEGGDIIMGFDPTFDRKEGERRNMFLVKKIFTQLERTHLFNQFLRVLVFDTIIGNTDRHQDNWGFILDSKTREISLAPAFDNTSLGSELVEEKLSGYLAGNAVKLRQYISKGKAHMRWSDDGEILIRVSHFELLKNISQKIVSVVDDVKEMTAFSDDQIEAILDGLSGIKVDNPKFVLSETRRNLIKNIICIRRDLLKEEFKLK